MRFLQVEWHNHERARNSWDIERAELKAKIARTEGDFRNSKKLNSTLDKHIRLLEASLRREREKNKGVPRAEPPPYQEKAKQEANGVPKEQGETELGILLFERRLFFFPDADIETALEKLYSDHSPDVEAEARKLTEEEKDVQREKTKQFLQKSVEELTYILTPPAHPPPPLPDPQEVSRVDSSQQMAPEEIYVQQAQMKRNQQAGISHLPSVSNHHPPPVRQPAELVNSGHQASQLQAHPMSRQPSQPPPSHPPPLPEEIAEMRLPRERLSDERDRSDISSQSFDPYARQVITRADEIDTMQPLLQDDNDGWNFDDDALDPRKSDVDLFPAANSLPPKSPTKTGLHTRRRSSGSQRLTRKPSDGSHEVRDLSSPKGDVNFKVQFALRGHLDVIRSIIFTGGGSPSEPEICTASDDGTLKRWIIPAKYGNLSNGNPQQSSSQSLPDLDLQAYFTHRGHEGIVTSLAACPASPSFSTGGRALGDGWVFSGGSDATIRVWERGRVDPKATIEGHTDAIWALSILPAPVSTVLGPDSYLSPSQIGENRIILISGSADSTIKLWAVSAPPQLSSPQNAPGASARRGVGGTRRHSITSGSNFPSSPQPSIASNTPFNYTLVHSICLPSLGSPTCISPLGPLGESFVVSWTDASILIFQSKTGEQLIGMASDETYDGTVSTGINSVVVTSATVENVGNAGDEVDGATGSNKDGGIEGVIISGHEDRYVRFFDANSGTSYLNFFNLYTHANVS